MNDLSVVSLAVSLFVGIATVMQRLFFDPRDVRLKVIEDNIVRLQEASTRFAIEIAKCDAEHDAVSHRNEEMSSRVATLDHKFDQVREMLAKIESSVAVLVERSSK